jgi:gliding motility-associated-like protein
MKNTIICFILACLSVNNASALNIKIVESTSINSAHVMDSVWNTTATSMGHTASIHPQTLLDNNLFFSTTDILIVSSGVASTTPTREATILAFLKTGKPVYLQSEYLPTYATNILFDNIVDSLGGSFNWVTNLSGNLGPVNILGNFAINNNATSIISYFWYSVTGVGDCHCVPFLVTNSNEYHGFQVFPSNPSYGTIITTTDQDWVNQSINIQLMENIITNMISPVPVAGNISLNLGNDTVICNPTFNLLLNAGNAGSTYLWQNGSTNQTFNATSAGTYWVTISSGSCIATDTIKIYSTLNDTNFLPNDTSLCIINNFQINATYPNAASYQWQNGSTNPIFAANQSGKYWVTVNTINGCTISDTINVTQKIVGSVSLGNDTNFCNLTSYILQPIATNVYSYTWQNASTSNTFNATGSGKYWVKVVFNNGCTNTDTINIVSNSSIPVNIGKDTTFCALTPYTLSLNISNANYLWQDGSTFNSIVISQFGTYYVTVTTANGCIGSDTMKVLQSIATPINIGQDTTICNGQTLLLSTGVSQATFAWSNGSTTPNISVTNKGKYFVTVNEKGCISSDTININYTEPLSVNLGLDKTLCNNTKVELIVSAINATYKWQDGSTLPTFIVSSEGIYWVEATNACETVKDEIYINYKLCDCEVFVPNVFTPNGDQKNDYFFPVYSCSPTDYKLIVYDRWGTQLYETNNYTSKWNGTYKNNLVNEGVYFYYIKFSFPNKAAQELKGDFTILY